VARSSYVHPVVVEAYVNEALPMRTPGADLDPDLSPATVSRRDELAVLRLLARRSSLLAGRVPPRDETQAQ
jgi:DNA topoisomerase IB